MSAATAISVLDMLARVVCTVDLELYQGQQAQALARIGDRDADDWPVRACALTFGCPIWTEDADLFGTGVATWTTQRVLLYLTAESD